MKKVSLEVAKALKEVGYPQDEEPITEIGWYNKAGIYTKQLPAFWEGDDMLVAIAPTYLDAWLWLWRKKRIAIHCDALDDNRWISFIYHIVTEIGNDPEEAITAAIEYLVENNLIK